MSSTRQFGPVKILTFFLIMVLPVACGRQTTEELWSQAQAAIAKGDYQAAVIYLKNIAQTDPDDVEAVLLLADIALTSGDARSAEQQYRRAFQRGATEEQIRMGLFESLLELKEYQIALDAADPTVTEVSDERANILKMRGRAYASIGQLDDALAAFEQAAQLEREDSVDTYVYLADLHRAANRQDASNDALKRALEIDADDPAALVRRGLRELSEGQSSAAESTFETAATVAQQRIATQRLIEQRRTSNARLAALYQIAELQLRQGRLDDASRTASKLTEAAPDYLQTRFIRARLASESGDAQSAKQLLQGILSVQERFWPAQRLLGMIYALEGNNNLADMHLRPYVSAHPQDMAARRIMIKVLLAQNRYEDAIDLVRGSEDGLGAEVEQSVLAQAGEASFRSGATDAAMQYFSEGAKAFPEDQRFAVGRAMALSAEGRSAEAIAILEGLETTESRDARASSLLALAYLQNSRVAEAQSVAARILENSPDQASSHNLLGAVHIAAGEPDRAYASFVRALELDEDNQFALISLANIDQLRGNIEAAVSKLQRVLKIYPNDAGVRLTLARVEIGTGNIDSALFLLRPVENISDEAKLLIGLIEFQQRDLASARNTVTAVTRAERSNALAYNLLGLIDLAEGANDAAAQNFDSAVRINPTIPGYQLNLARAHLARNDQEAARAAIDRTRLLDPGSLQLLALETILFTRTGDYVRAEERLSSLEMGGADPQLRLVMLGDLRQAQGQFGAAAEAFEGAYSRQPSLQLAMRAARARQAAGIDNPMTLLSDWIGLNPGDIMALKVLASWLMGREQFKVVQQYLERLTVIDPQDAGSLNDLAWAYHQTNDSRALQTAQRAYVLQPANAAIADTLGWIHLASGNTESALELLITAANAAPQIAEIQYHLAIAYRDSGDVTAAKRVLAEILETNQSFPSRQDAVQALGTL